MENNTPLLNRHLALGARLVPFAGWRMPVCYDRGIIAEHQHTRNAASLFDICHMGEFRIRGRKAADALDHALARAVTSQPVGACRYNFLLNETGGVIDDLLVYRLDDDEFYLVVNAGNREVDAETIRARLSDEADFTDESDSTAKLDLQGPASADALAALGLNKDALPGYYRWMETIIAGIPCLLSRTGYTGELGYEIYTGSRHAEVLWDAVAAAPGVLPAGLGARDTLRLEMAYPLHGHELDAETTPVEGGFGAMVKLSDERGFVGSEALKNNPPTKYAVGLRLDGRRAAREGSKLSVNGEAMGVVSSGAFAPSLGTAVALAFSARPLATGTRVALSAGRAELPGTVVETPFYRDGTARAKP